MQEKQGRGKASRERVGQPQVLSTQEMGDQGLRAKPVKRVGQLKVLSTQEMHIRGQGSDATSFSRWKMNWRT